MKISLRLTRSCWPARCVWSGLLCVSLLLAACDGVEEVPQAPVSVVGDVLVLCEGNLNAGNSTLSAYNSIARTVENGVFQRINQRKLGDTGQSVTLHGGSAYIAVENSGIVWQLDAATLKVTGQLVTGQTEHMIDPRYIHFVSDTKAYITDLYAPYITIFNPQTMQATGSIATGQPVAGGYASTEQMVQWDRYVFTNCWCYSHNILVVDTQRDEVCDSIVLGGWQPKQMVIDARGKLWVITDGGYNTAAASFGDNTPHLYCIDASTREIERDEVLDTDEGSVLLALSPEKLTLYVVNNDIYRMQVTDAHLPVRPFLEVPKDEKGRRHKIYGMAVDPRTGELYLADAVDNAQAGAVFRYRPDGTLVDQFRVGISPNGFAFLNTVPATAGDDQ
ncbi:MAG: SMP-30/gluconolactonase/LRE family protein [Bacteroidaceae bacterium]|nr:SMP-30/gluconolactonase/LRE family protein [Bacteroidaceae bacterium]